MGIVSVVRDRFEASGITIAELARRIGMDRELLRRCLNGSRKITADELVALCRELGLTLEDFYALTA
jgi:plasmid maintenance system antidote protein VapI